MADAPSQEPGETVIGLKSLAVVLPSLITQSAVRARAWREKQRKENPEYLESERSRAREWRKDNPSATRAGFKKWEADNSDWIDAYREDRRSVARKSPFIAIDSEGQNYPLSDNPERDIVYDGVVYPPHGTYLWGASPIENGKADYLVDPRSKGANKYKLSVTAIFDWLLDKVKPRYGDANYVMFGMSYDMSQLLLQLPRETAYEIFKAKRFEDDEEVRAPVFWKDYAIKLIKGKWLTLWRLRNRDYPYLVDEAGEYVLDKKDRKQLDAIQKIQIYETYTYFQTGFAKVVDDMLMEERAAIAKRLAELKAREQHLLTPEHEAELRKALAGKRPGWFINATGVRIERTAEDQLRGEREYEAQLIREERERLAAGGRQLARDVAIIAKMKALRGRFDKTDIEPITEYMTAEIRLLSKRMEQVRGALAELGLHPTSWHGPGAVASALIEKYKIREHFGNDIVSADISPQQEFAHSSFSGGRIELLKQGYMKIGYLASYDLSSAYPAGAVELPSLAPQAGQWVQRNKAYFDFSTLEELREKIEETSIVSMFQIRWVFPSFSKLAKGGKLDPASEFIPFFPLWFRKSSGGILCPSSGAGRFNREDVLTAIEWMERYMPKYPKNTYSNQTRYDNEPALFVIEDARIWEMNEEYKDVRPFAILKELYARRRTIKDDVEQKNAAIDERNKEIEARNKADGTAEPLLPLEYNILEKVIKLVLNSVYGKLAQYVGSAGKVPNCANPYYAAAITAYCRRRVLTAALIDPAAIVFFATDGIVSTRSLHILPDAGEHVRNSFVKPHKGETGLARVKDEKQGDKIELGDWEYKRRDGGIFVMAGVYAHYKYRKDANGKPILDDKGNPKLDLVGKLRGADATKYKASESGQPWLVENTLKAWREPFDLDDVSTYPRIETAYKKYVTVGSVLTPRFSRAPNGRIIENNAIAAAERFKRAGRWTLDASDRRNEEIRRENEAIRKQNEELLASHRARGKSRYPVERQRRQEGSTRPRGLMKEKPEIVFKRTIHVHNVGIKRRHIMTRPHCYLSLTDWEALRCRELIETIPSDNLIKNEDGEFVRNLEMSTPRLPQWLNKDDELRVEEEEDREEVNYSTLCYDDGAYTLPADQYEGT